MRHGPLARRCTSVSRGADRYRPICANVHNNSIQIGSDKQTTHRSFFFFMLAIKNYRRNWTLIRLTTRSCSVAVMPFWQLSTRINRLPMNGITSTRIPLESSWPALTFIFWVDRHPDDRLGDGAPERWTDRRMMARVPHVSWFAWSTLRPIESHSITKL